MQILDEAGKLERFAGDKQSSLFRLLFSVEVKSFRTLTPGACSIKHYLFVKNVFRNKLACLSRPVVVTENSDKALAYYGICPCTVHYKSSMFSSTSPGMEVFTIDVRASLLHQVI
jgi:hypothetical protein